MSKYIIVVTIIILLFLIGIWLLNCNKTIYYDADYIHPASL